MKVKWFSGLALLVLVLFSPLVIATAEEGDALQNNGEEIAVNKTVEPGAYVKGEVVVQFKDRVSASKQEQILQDVGAKVQATPEVVRSPFLVLEVGNVDAVVNALSKNKNVEFAEPNYILKAAWSPNDTYFSPSYQYGLFNTSANSAWDVARGSSSQEIAVLDTGVDYNHPDLDGKTIRGYDFVDRDYTPSDLNGHGTHVAGIAAAETNNGTGIAGMAPNTRILAVRVLDANGSGSLANIANGIRYAADNGAEVINLSLGCACDTRALEDAVNYAWNRGSVVVAAAGNDGTSQQFQPASYANAIAVGAVDRNNNKASFSNWGTWVDVAAPGVDIASTYPGNRYVYLSGTSMASPYVAGQAALLTGQGRSNSQVRAAIQNTTDSMNGSGYYVRYGVINAYNAVRY
ncbi:S8 family serine peptidase [Ornithinibacillus sp. L9]|uniref:S8 family serine peptidase n=1 Tax=Ornithinibacillus caprae TaxID=2678566 RepID=A0A6N8FLS8_9BACI|nr:S8 family peptidase [Ornithinibacillus caprae]MUK90425.1 S8 family serine peptidase [Ornithinibacillus caprae]QYA18257.1 serine protease P3862 [Ornithinibacillus caprae]